MINRRTLLLSAALPLAACSGADLLNIATPSDGFELAADISFAPYKRGLMDFYSPRAPRPGAPVIVFLYGGGWTEGKKDDYKFVAQSFASAGYTVAIPDYRLYPDVRYPEIMVDPARAVAFVARRYPGRRIVLMGHSAGAHLAMMLAVAPRFLEAEGLDRCSLIAGVVGLSGPYGITALKEEPYISVFPDRFTGDDAPLGNLGKPVPPVFLASGLEDKTVIAKNARTLAAALKRQGGSVESAYYPEFGHTDTVRVLSALFASDADLLPRILAFVEKQGPRAQGYCR